MKKTQQTSLVQDAVTLTTFITSANTIVFTNEYPLVYSKSGMTRVQVRTILEPHFFIGGWVGSSSQTISEGLEELSKVQTPQAHHERFQAQLSDSVDDFAEYRFVVAIRVSSQMVLPAEYAEGSTETHCETLDIVRGFNCERECVKFQSQLNTTLRNCHQVRESRASALYGRLKRFYSSSFGRQVKAIFSLFTGNRKQRMELEGGQPVVATPSLKIPKQGLRWAGVIPS